MFLKGTSHKITNLDEFKFILLPQNDNFYIAIIHSNLS